MTRPGRIPGSCPSMDLAPSRHHAPNGVAVARAGRAAPALRTLCPARPGSVDIAPIGLLSGGSAVRSQRARPPPRGRERGHARAQGLRCVASGSTRHADRQPPGFVPGRARPDRGDRRPADIPESTRSAPPIPTRLPALAFVLPDSQCPNLLRLHDCVTGQRDMDVALSPRGWTGMVLSERAWRTA